MSYLRMKIAPVRANPPPGKHTGETELKVHLSCETPEVEIIYTMDGSLPIANSPRAHGFQSQQYSDVSGIMLKGGGLHVITVIVHREGYVSPKYKKFRYELGGPPARPKSQPLGDVIIERRFNAMAELDPPMPLRLARARTPNLTCALVDTCPKEVLAKKRKAGEEVALFELTHNSRSVSRQDTYRRIVAPSMSLPLPQLPTRAPLVVPNSLRSSMSSRFNLTSYERMDFAESLARSKKPKGVVVKKTPLGVKEVYKYRPPKSEIGSMSHTQMTWFENRTGLTPNPDDDYDDPLEQAETKVIAEASQSTLQKELDRKSFSPMFARVNNNTSVSIATDVARDSKAIVSLMYSAKEFCHSQISRLLGFVSYHHIASKLGKAQSFGAAEIAQISEGGFTVAEAHKGLAWLPSTGPKQYETKSFLLLCRYCVWAARPIPEAIFGLVMQFWKATTLANGGTEVRITQLDFQLILDNYRRTRGAHLPSVDLLYEKSLKFPWGADEDDGKMPYGILQSSFVANFPMIDSALVEMSNNAHPMYHTPLSTWGDLHH